MTSVRPGTGAVEHPRWYANPEARHWTCPPAPSAVGTFHRSLPGYAPTPLVESPALAEELAVGRVFVKDESRRLGLPAFKVLGASWAVHRAVAEQLDVPRPGTLAELRELLAEHARVVGADAVPRLVTATDGNHGRALAHVARLLRLPATVYVPRGVSPRAVAAVTGEGAEVVRVAGSYDEAVRRAGDAAGNTTTLLVQDTAWAGYERVPGWVVDGYQTLFAEIDAELAAVDAGPAGLVVVPVGVGSLAQAAVTHYRSRPRSPGRSRAALLAVEPDTAACTTRSLTAGHPVSVATPGTIMAGLDCGTVSSLAWPYLRDGLDAVVTVTDARAAQAVRDLDALEVSAGPCGAAALAGLRTALSGPDAAEHRRHLTAGARRTVVLLNTEGRAANPLGAEHQPPHPEPSGR